MSLDKLFSFADIDGDTFIIPIQINRDGNTRIPLNRTIRKIGNEELEHRPLFGKQNRIDVLEAEIQSLKAKNAELEKRLAALENSESESEEDSFDRELTTQSCGDLETLLKMMMLRSEQPVKKEEDPLMTYAEFLDSVPAEAIASVYITEENANEFIASARVIRIDSNEKFPRSVLLRFQSLLMAFTF